MKITPFGNNPINAYKSQAKKTNQTNNENIKSKGDSVEISKTAKETAKYQAEMKKMPDIREDKVRELKERIENGTYKPSVEKIAEGMIKERRLDELV
ncbi:MAG: flagellar biosynthesis anti-sigma factor FlgM [Firmicutes bacterium]|nr:flagellar biosynthesis anti-sigma factor FlgM [Bacillota bacterium]